MRESYYLAAVHTLTAPQWKLWLARLFGKRVVGMDGKDTVICYHWRGRVYLSDYRPYQGTAAT